MKVKVKKWVDEEALKANIAAAETEAKENGETSTYGMDTLWSYSKSPASKDTSLVRVATVCFVVNEKTGEVLSYRTEALE